MTFVALLLAALASACSPPVAAAPATTAADVTNRPVATASPTTTPRPSAPVVAWRPRVPGPDLLHDHSWGGAEAYVEDYLERLDDAWTVPRPSLLDNRASKECGTCANFREGAAYLFRKGQRHEAPMLTVSDVSVVIWKGGVRVVADVRQTDHRIVTRTGRTIRRIDGERAYLYVLLSYRGRWWIDAIGIERVNDDGTYRDVSKSRTVGRRR
ncbi:hypothetical protein GCM10023258_04560 [Terrabacter aeriphilus]|uniref:DUF4440 domain-containing protein n=1 Tax=Terrabacter aeriphilus TaxID=515662 RepID=A0ABP9J4P4_9MICO